LPVTPARRAPRSSKKDKPLSQIGWNVSKASGTKQRVDAKAVYLVIFREAAPCDADPEETDIIIIIIKNYQRAKKQKT